LLGPSILIWGDNLVDNAIKGIQGGRCTNETLYGRHHPIAKGGPPNRRKKAAFTGAKRRNLEFLGHQSFRVLGKKNFSAGGGGGELAGGRE